MGWPDVDSSLVVLRHILLPCPALEFCKDLYLNSFQTFLTRFSGETTTKRSLLQFVLTFARNKDGFGAKLSPAFWTWCEGFINSSFHCRGLEIIYIKLIFKETLVELADTSSYNVCIQQKNNHDSCYI